MEKKLFNRTLAVGVGCLALCAVGVSTAAAVPCLPGQAPAFPGSDTCILDPLIIPKYVDDLVIPPVMPTSTNQPGTIPADYNIAVRQFRQQILPTGFGFAATPVWSYGLAEDPVNHVAPNPAVSTFNYPAFTIETQATGIYGPGAGDVTVRWINDLQDANGPLPHLLGPVVDQTLHWANPAATGCRMGDPNRTDCATDNPDPYLGPVPIVTHVHGAHVNPDSDGYPEAWWLPSSASAIYTPTGSLFDEAITNNDVPGSAYYSYRNDQPATTLWYHDHSLGMTRLNVYAGPAGFWMIRDNDDTGGPPVDLNNPSVGDNLLGLPGPAPGYGSSPATGPFYEIPIVIQDRSFNPDGTLFYPANRAFFEGLNPAGGTPPTIDIPFIGDPTFSSDIASTWNPEAFFNTMVVNGKTWPVLNVEPRRYRLRLLNGCNSRFLNLAMFQVNKAGNLLKGSKWELPFYQIGAEQGFLPNVVQISTGYATLLPGGGIIPRKLTRAPNKDQALLLGLAERADVIVDFSNLPPGTIVRMINTAPDAPFGGFPDVAADPATTGQVMQFVVGALPAGVDNSLPPQNLDLAAVAESPLNAPTTDPRNVSLNEEESVEVCVQIDPKGNITYLQTVLPGTTFWADCTTAGGVPFAPKAALLGQVDLAGVVPVGIPLKWTDSGGPGAVLKVVPLTTGGTVNVTVTENPAVGATEDWWIYNFTMDAHPIHLHLVRFNVVGRTLFDGVTPAPIGIQAWETGFKDTVIAYPGEITQVRAKFDIEGLYVWHCHIVEHEDNEMMRPYIVGL